MFARWIACLVIAAALRLAFPLVASDQPDQAVPYRSPASVAFSPDGELLYVYEIGSNTIAVVEFRSGHVRDRLAPGDEDPAIDPAQRRPPAGVDLGLSLLGAGAARSPEGPVRAARFRIAQVAYLIGQDTLAMVDLRRHRAYLGSAAEGREGLRAFDVGPNPHSAALTPDGRRLLVTCDTPTELNRSVSVVDGGDESVIRVSLPGATSLRGIAVSPDGRFALVAHVQARSHLPATQVAQGWVFTNVMTYLPLDGGSGPVSLPLDHPTEFFATPFDVVIAGDGKTAYVSHAGADVVSVLDVNALEQTARELAVGGGDYDGARDLRLSWRYVKARIPVGANPRALALNPSGDRLVAANYLGDSLSVIDVASNQVVETIPLGARQADLARRGEQLFNSARLSFSGQFACASCHPDGGADGLNWDLAADGIGNFKNTKTLLGVHGTGPFGWLGTTATLPERFGTTLRQTFQHEPTGEELKAISAYLEQLGPSAAPRRVDPASPEAMRGRELFHDVAGCGRCHRGPHLTDGQRHHVGTAGPTDLAETFDTPSLVGVSETPPYLHDGRAATLESIFLEHNESGRHGSADQLTEEELADLVAFLKSL